MINSAKLRNGIGIFAAMLLVCIVIAVNTPRGNRSIATEYVYADIEGARVDNTPPPKYASTQVSSKLQKDSLSSIFGLR